MTSSGGVNYRLRNIGYDYSPAVVVPSLYRLLNIGYDYSPAVVVPSLLLFCSYLRYANYLPRFC